MQSSDDNWTLEDDPRSFLPSAVGNKTFSSVFAFLSLSAEKDSSWDFKSSATFGKSFKAGAAMTQFLLNVRRDCNERREEKYC